MRNLPLPGLLQYSVIGHGAPLFGTSLIRPCPGGVMLGA
jgi:hypothetical protein